MRLIDADALMDVVGQILVPYNAAYAAYQIKTAIDEAPTIDATPRSMLDAAIAEIPHICPTCGRFYAVDGEPKSCPVIMQCAKKNCWEWKGLKNG